MKKTLKLFTAVILIACFILAVGCSKKEPLVLTDKENYVVITVPNAPEKGATLLDYMKNLRDDGEFTFTLDGTMVTSINGTANASDWSACWMLYTDDEEMANSSWGTAEYSGKIIGSAVVGAEALLVKQGCIYVWVYQSF